MNQNVANCISKKIINNPGIGYSRWVAISVIMLLTPLVGKGMGGGDLSTNGISLEAGGGGQLTSFTLESIVGMLFILAVARNNYNMQ